MTCTLKKVRELFVFSGSPWVWVLTSECGARFSQYRTKAEALADAKKYGIKVV